MAQPTDNQTSTASLQDFSLDDDVEFFGIKNTEKQNITEVKGNKIADKAQEKTSPIKTASNTNSSGAENEEDGDDDEVTTFFGLDEEGKEEVSKPKAKAKAKVKEEEEEEEEDSNKEEDDDDDKPKKKSTAKAKAKEVEEEQEGEDDDDEDEDDDKKSKSKKKGEKEEGEDDLEFFTTLVDELKEKGIFQNIEVKKGETITEDKFFELQDKEIESRVDEALEEFSEAMDEQGKAFIKFKRAGGDTAVFFQALQNQLSIEDFDKDDPIQVQKVLKFHLTTVEKLEDDELADRLAYLKEKGSEKTYAERWYASAQKNKEKLAEGLVKAQQAAAQKREDDAKEFNDSVKEVLQKTSSVGSFPISKTDQKELDTYITKPTVKTKKNTYVPGLHADLSRILSGKTEKDKKQLIILGKLIKNQFDIKDLETKVTTQVTKQAKSKLVDAKNSVKASSRGQSTGQRALADNFS